MSVTAIIIVHEYSAVKEWVHYDCYSQHYCIQSHVLSALAIITHTPPPSLVLATRYSNSADYSVDSRSKHQGHSAMRVGIMSDLYRRLQAPEGDGQPGNQ